MVASPLVFTLLATVFGLFGVSGPSATSTSHFRNPLNTSADPTMVHDGDSYYLATTQGDRIRIWRSPSLATLLNAPAVDVWQDPDPSRNQQMWAPAMYRFDTDAGARWYVYYTASDGNDVNHRMYVIESAGDDPMGPYAFKNKVFDVGEYAIDGEPFRHNGLLYFAWASPGRGQGGPAQIYVAPMANPWTVSGSPVAVPVDGGCTEVREGPTFLSRNGRTWLTYSTCDTGKPDYQIWMTSIADDADPLVPGNWVQHPGAVFSRDDGKGVWGPGHHFFFTSPDGTEDWIAYHTARIPLHTTTAGVPHVRKRSPGMRTGRPTLAPQSPWVKTCPCHPAIQDHRRV